MNNDFFSPSSDWPPSNEFQVNVITALEAHKQDLEIVDVFFSARKFEHWVW